jgi:hypothetical protein
LLFAHNPNPRDRAKDQSTPPPGTCKLNHVEPYAYLTDVLTRMVDGHPVNRLDELLPWTWKPEIHVKT